MSVPGCVGPAERGRSGELDAAESFLSVSVHVVGRLKEVGLWNGTRQKVVSVPVCVGPAEGDRTGEWDVSESCVFACSGPTEGGRDCGMGCVRKLCLCLCLCWTA